MGLRALSLVLSQFWIQCLNQWGGSHSGLSSISLPASSLRTSLGLVSAVFLYCRCVVLARSAGD
ncbi:hypothetical protein AZE42_10400 [Rhizopogon vesiculosus]|uniref:Uncharacterized protein n=1 Tax=Rhizopogon vesiculosus TaxID=180088 RepID=A0A1J8Q1G2_9AGAM|nr:hypothetical protein AZE42_10400 [Rhizopogon vesiculosus]